MMFGISAITFILAGLSFGLGWTGGGIFFGIVNLLSFAIGIITAKGGGGYGDDFPSHPGDFQ